jgi:hypothetical protein
LSDPDPPSTPWRNRHIPPQDRGDGEPDLPWLLYEELVEREEARSPHLGWSERLGLFRKALDEGKYAVWGLVRGEKRRTRLSSPGRLEVRFDHVRRARDGAVLYEYVAIYEQAAIDKASQNAEAKAAATAEPPEPKQPLKNVVPDRAAEIMNSGARPPYTPRWKHVLADQIHARLTAGGRDVALSSVRRALYGYKDPHPDEPKGEEPG